MSEIDADFFLRELKPFNVRREQIQHEHDADEITARHHGNMPAAVRRSGPDEEALKPPLLRLPQPFVDLGEGAEKDEHDADGEAGDGEAERREETPNAVDHGWVFAKAMKDSRAAVTAGASPMSL